jgi:hypothetical protein
MGSPQPHWPLAQSRCPLLTVESPIRNGEGGLESVGVGNGQRARYPELVLCPCAAPLHNPKTTISVSNDVLINSSFLE